MQVWKLAKRRMFLLKVLHLMILLSRSYSPSASIVLQSTSQHDEFFLTINSFECAGCSLGFEEGIEGKQLTD
jgi:hypothetical protein